MAVLLLFLFHVSESTRDSVSPSNSTVLFMTRCVCMSACLVVFVV